jgi:hypothetical protein
VGRKNPTRTPVHDLSNDLSRTLRGGSLLVLSRLSPLRLSLSAPLTSQIDPHSLSHPTRRYGAPLAPSVVDSSYSTYSLTPCLTLNQVSQRLTSRSCRNVGYDRVPCTPSMFHQSDSPRVLRSGCSLSRVTVSPLVRRVPVYSFSLCMFAGTRGRGCPRRRGTTSTQALSVSAPARARKRCFLPPVAGACGAPRAGACVRAWPRNR